MVQAAPTHWAVPFGSVGQVMHVLPQAATSLSAEHLVPHLCVPVVHWKSHLVPSHVACDAPVGTGQGRHELPQAFTSITDGHNPPHRCCPVGHISAHAAPVSMQLPRHSFLPAGHMPPHDIPSQVAVPSLGA